MAWSRTPRLPVVLGCAVVVSIALLLLSSRSSPGRATPCPPPAAPTDCRCPDCADTSGAGAALVLVGDDTEVPDATQEGDGAMESGDDANEAWAAPVPAPVTGRSPANPDAVQPSADLFVTPKPSYSDAKRQAQAQIQQSVFGLGDPGSRWIDVTPTGRASVKQLREWAGQLQQHKLVCKTQKLASGLVRSRGPKSVEACGWEGEAVSGDFLKNFKWEHRLWNWIPQAFEDAAKSARRQGLTFVSPTCNAVPGVLDLGVNVGDWMTPLRLALRPSVPLYGVEGLASNAALAASNILAAATAAASKAGGATLAPTKLLPYGLSSPPLVAKAATQGGICFSTRSVTNLGAQGMFNNAKVVGQGKDDTCSPQALAGVTTLDNALRGAACDTSAWPSLLVAKFDIEGAELLALSTVSPWLHQQPPCYVVIETSGGANSVGALSFLWAHGYDSLWVAKKLKGKPPHAAVPKAALVHKASMAEMLTAVHRLKRGDFQRKYKRSGKDSGLSHDFVVGRSDFDACVAQLLTRPS